MISDSTPRYPTSRQPILGADYWLQRARITRSKAAATHDPRLQERLRRVALEYDRLAAHAAQRPTVEAPALVDDQHLLPKDQQLSLAL